MSAKACPFCGKGSRDGLLCHRCTRDTKEALARIAELWPALQQTITRQDNLSAPNEIRAETIYGPIPFKPQAAEVATETRADLVPWVRICVEDFGAPCPPDVVPAFCLLLSAYADQLRKRDDAEDWADTIRLRRDEISAAVDLPTERSKVTTGPCPEHTEDGEPCGGVVVAIYPSNEGLSPHMDCTKPPELAKEASVCGKKWPAKDWARLGPRILARQAQIAEQKSRGKRAEQAAAQYIEPAEWMGARMFLSVADASVVYGIPRTTLDRWLGAGRINTYEVPATVLGKARVRVVIPEDVRRAKVEEEARETDAVTRRENLLRRQCVGEATRERT